MPPPPSPPLSADAPAEIRRIEAQHPLQRRAWRIERIGWGAMLLLILAALLGATGEGGPLARGEALTPDGALRIRYDRIQRRDSSTRLMIEVLGGRGAAVAADGRVGIRLGGDFAEGWRLEAVVPPADSATTGPAGLLLHVALAPAASDGGGAATAPRPPRILLFARTGRPPLLARLEVAAGAGPPARLGVLVWP